MTDIVTASGFHCHVEESRLNDMTLLEALRELDEGDTFALIAVLDAVLREEKQALYDHVRTPEGTVPTEAVMGELAEIFNAMKGEGKK